MIIILDDDPVYLSWIRRHRAGFVLDTKRNPTKRNTTLHRASCAAIRNSKSKRTHWTTGSHVKACSEGCAKLTEWAGEQIGSDPKFCDMCDPVGDILSVTATAPISDEVRPLTKLENDLVSAVVESAVIHLDNELDFRMTVGDVAQYLSKTPAQISTALGRLVSEQMLEIELTATSDKPLPPTLEVFPTARSLCTVPAFAAMESDDLQRELASLHVRAGSMVKYS